MARLRSDQMGRGNRLKWKKEPHRDREVTVAGKAYTASQKAYRPVHDSVRDGPVIM
jgi:hypothetical protein